MKTFFSAFFIFSFSIGSAQDSSRYTTTEIIYGRKDGMALTMVEIMPKHNAKGKAIISVVSGNWVSNYTQLPGFIRRSQVYINGGYTVFLVMHGSQPRYAINDETEDIKRAVRFVRFYAKLFGIDSARIGITGASSGGHLALMTALADDVINVKSKDPADKVSSRVQAAAVFFPPTDFLNWGGPNMKTNKEMIRLARVDGAFDFKTLSDSTGMYEHITGDEANMQIGKAMSPISNVSSDDPPVMIVHGDADPVVPLQQSLSLIEKLKAAGVKNQLIIKEKAGHGWSDTKEEENAFMLWFDKYLK